MWLDVRKMQLMSDPFVRKRTVRIIAILDQAIAGLLLVYAGYRLISSDFRDQNIIIFIGATDNALIAIIFWLGVFALIGLQLVIAFLLLAATKDMTTDPETMIKKCHFWRTFSVILLTLLTFDTAVAIYIYLTRSNVSEGLAPVFLHGGEIIFRGLGIYIVGKFIGDLHTLFGAPMVTHSNVSTPVFPRNSRTSSMRSSSHLEHNELTPDDVLPTRNSRGRSPSVRSKYEENEIIINEKPPHNESFRQISRNISVKGQRDQVSQDELLRQNSKTPSIRSQNEQMSQEEFLRQTSRTPSMRSQHEQMSQDELLRQTSRTPSMRSQNEKQSKEELLRQTSRASSTRSHDQVARGDLLRQNSRTASMRSQPEPIPQPNEDPIRQNPRSASMRSQRASVTHGLV